MLKAVRLDDEIHKDIIKFIEDYVDEKGKNNESAAIRHLIVNGYKSLNPDFIPLEKEVLDINKLKKELMKEFEINQIDQIKSQLREELIKEINVNSPSIENIRYQIREELVKEMNLQKDQNISLILDKLNRLEQHGMQPVYIQQTPQVIQQPIQQTEIKPSIKEEAKQIINNVEEKISTKKVDIPVDTNPLLANILANANR